MKKGLSKVYMNIIKEMYEGISIKVKSLLGETGFYGQSRNSK